MGSAMGGGMGMPMPPLPPGLGQLFGMMGGGGGPMMGMGTTQPAPMMAQGNPSTAGNKNGGQMLQALGAMMGKR